MERERERESYHLCLVIGTRKLKRLRSEILWLNQESASKFHLLAHNFKLIGGGGGGGGEREEEKRNFL